MARQVLHLADVNNNHLVEVVKSAVRREVQKYTQSATIKGIKKTMETYSGCISRFCLWGEEVIRDKEDLFVE